MATNDSGGEILAGFLRKAATELEKLQVQLALGEAEASDKYEEAKKKLARFVNNTKAKVGTMTRSSVTDMKADLEDLQVQLALGKADSKDAFIDQKKKINKAMDKLERNIKNKYKETGFEDELLHEIETMRMKMGVLEVNFELGKMEARDEFEKRKHDFAEMIAKAKNKVKMSKKEFAQRRQKRHAEMKEAYRHLKKAVIQ